MSFKAADFKTREQLLAENEELRRRVAELECADRQRKLAEQALRESEALCRTLAESTKDIVMSERKTANDALRASEERFRIAFEEAPVGIVMGVAHGTLTRVNRTFCQMTGYTEKELLGMSIYELTHPEDVGRTEELHERLEAGDVDNYAIEKRYLTKEGGFFWAQVTAAPIHDRDGRIIFGIGIIENITQRKLAQQSLAQEQRTLSHLLQASDHERQLIAYDIHDGLAQELAGAIMQFQICATRGKPGQTMPARFSRRA